MNQEIKTLFKELSCCVLVPTYNNEKTVGDLLSNILCYCDDVIVVDDGSTQATKDILKHFEDRITLHSEDKNRGKGAALKVGFKKAEELGFRYTITIDSDGQHFPEDLELFLNKIKENPDAMILGARNMEQDGIPRKSSFGHKFSNFWFWFETGLKVPDTQTGYRLYPLREVQKLSLFTNRFEFEIEIIVKLAWNSVPVLDVPVKVVYDMENRVTHFRPFQDFARVSLINIYLVVLTLLWHLPIRLFVRGGLWRAIKTEANKPEESAVSKASAIGVGVFCGILPIWGFQMWTALAIAWPFKLNKVMVIAASNISIPPLIPFILYGSYVTGGILMGNESPLLFNRSLVLENVKVNLIQYLIGSSALAIAAGLLSLGMSYLIILAIRKK